MLINSGLLLLLASVLEGKLLIQPFGPSVPTKSFVTNPNLSNSLLTNLFITAGLSTPKDVIISHLANELGLSSEDYIIKDLYTSKHNGVTHAYLRQLVDGKEVYNGDININLDSQGKVISLGNSFYAIKGSKKSLTSSFHQLFFSPSSYQNKEVKEQIKFPKKLVPIKDAFSSFLDYIGVSVNLNNLVVISTNSWGSDQPEITLSGLENIAKDIKVNLGWMQNNSGELVPVYEFELDLGDDWFHSHVSAQSKQMISLVNWVNEAEYRVYPFGVNDPLEGGRKLLINPADPIASPKGWHSQGNKEFTLTEGNNVIAIDGSAETELGWNARARADGGKELRFDFELDLKKTPDYYLNASVTNLFYVNNMLHDIYYLYGFTEDAGNFQETNYHENGGKGGDAVIAYAQDNGGYDNANFATPPDGRNPRMRMYVWDTSSPYRDGDLEEGIIIHEYTHGLSIRLTGGPSNSGCLGFGEAGGMGEGWGDAIATMFRMHKSYDHTINFGMGSYAAGGIGIRKYLYSTSMKTNPETYKVMDSPGYWGVHAKGATWAQMLYEVYWNLVDELSFTPNWTEQAKEPEKFGNTLMLQLLLDGMKLQPCRPTFMDARDAILQAEKQLTNGKYKCLIWKGFAKRGLGIGAKLIGGSPWGGGIRRNSFNLPVDC